MTKKMVGLLMMMMFIISMVPLALADEGIRDKSETKREMKLKGDIKDQKLEVRNNIKNKLNDGKEDLKERIKEFREKNVALKNKYNEAKDKLLEEKKSLKERRDKAKCSEETENCKENKRDLKRGVKKRLEKTTDLISRSLEKLKNRVENANSLSDVDKESALSSISNLEKDLEAENLKVTSMTEVASAKELSDSIKSLKKTWQEVRKIQKKVIANLTNSKMEKLVEKHQEYANGMQARIDDLKGQGLDVNKLEEILEKFNNEVTNLDKNFKLSKEAWLDSVGKENKLEEWRETQKAVRDDLKETKMILREFMQEYRDLKKDLKESDDSEDVDDSEDGTEDSDDKKEVEETTEEADEDES